MFNVGDKVIIERDTNTYDFLARRYGYFIFTMITNRINNLVRNKDILEIKRVRGDTLILMESKGISPIEIHKDDVKHIHKTESKNYSLF